MNKFFKHWGGKTLVLPKLLPHLPPVPTGWDFCEPFCGSGAIGLNLLPTPTGWVILSDLDPTPIAKWAALKTYGLDEYRRRFHAYTAVVWTPELVSAPMPLSPSQIETLRANMKTLLAMAPPDYTPDWGIWHHAVTSMSLLGWCIKKKDGTWRATVNTDYKFKAFNPGSNLAQYSQHVEVSCRDYRATLQSLPNPAQTYVYLDPPYVGTNSGMYKHGAWDLPKLKELLVSAKDVADLGAIVVLSHIASDPVLALIREVWPDATGSIFSRPNYARNHTAKGGKVEMLEVVATLNPPHAKRE